MTIRLQNGNVLDAQADALLLTTDGARPGLEGNVARAFSRRWPDAYEELVGQIAYPVPLGRTVLTRPESDCAFKAVLFASTLHHLDVLAERQRAGVVAAALQEAIGLAARHGIGVLATPVMTGGWRLPFDTALRAMFSSAGFLTQTEARTELQIYMLKEAERNDAVRIASEMGLTVVGSNTQQIPANQHQCGR